MAAVPELPLGQMVFFCLAKVSWGLSWLFYSPSSGNVEESTWIKGHQARRNLDPQKVFVKIPHQRLFIKLSHQGWEEDFVMGGGLA